MEHINLFWFLTLICHYICKLISVINVLFILITNFECLRKLLLLFTRIYYNDVRLHECHNITNHMQFKLVYFFFNSMSKLTTEEIFQVYNTAHLFWESTSHRWIPLVTFEFSSKSISNAESISMWSHRHVQHGDSFWKCIII